MPDLPALSPVDITALALVLIGTIIGAIRGLSGELPGLISAALSITAGIVFRAPLGLWLTDHSRLSNDSAFATAFYLAVIVTWLVMLIPNLLLGKIMKVVFEKGFHIVGGAIAGTLRMLIWIVILFLAMQMTPNDFLHEHFGERSWSGRGIHRLSPNWVTTSTTLDFSEQAESITGDLSDKLNDDRE